MKKKRLVVLISVLVIWIPVIFNLYYWNRLPNKIATHFNSQMVADGWSPKPVAVFLLPVILTAIQLFIIYLMERDPQKNNLQDWITYIVFAIIPVISLGIGFVVLSTALGADVDLYKKTLLNLVAGIMLIIVGIVLEYVKPNQTVGIRVPWTLHSPKNWQMTHRFGSKVFIVGGIAGLVAGMFSLNLLLIPILLIVITIPVIYSYVLHRKGI